MSYHVTAQRFCAIGSTHKHLVGLVHLVDHRDVIVAILKDKNKNLRSFQQSVMIRSNQHSYCSDLCSLFVELDCSLSTTPSSPQEPVKGNNTGLSLFCNLINWHKIFARDGLCDQKYLLPSEGLESWMTSGVFVQQLLQCLLPWEYLQVYLVQVIVTFSLSTLQ